MFMSNFTRCGGFASFWQSVTNLSCCNIDSISRHLKSMKTFVFTMLFMFMMVSVYGQNAGRSVFLDRCLADAPEPQFSQEDLEELYADECSSDLSFTVTPEIQGDDCDWQVIYTYTITCPDIDEPIIFKTIYRGGDQTAPELTGTIPDDQANLNLCFEDIPEGPSIEEIGAQFEDTCGTVIVEKSGDPVGDDCSWSVTYTYTVRDACNNYYENEIKVEYSGGDTEAPMLSDKAEIPVGNLNSEMCFDNKEQGPTAEEIAELFEDNCGNVNVTKVSESKGTDCKWLANYYYFVSDDCGNELDEPIVITYRGQDETPPVLMNIPEDVTVDCVDEIPEYPEKDAPYATDNCDNDVDVSFDEDASGLGIACEGGVVVRTWVAVDDCGVSATATQTITVLPAPKAVFDELAPEVDITCEELGSYQPAPLGYSNGVEDGACAINGEAQPQYTPITENCGSFEVFYSFTDECGHLIEATQVVNVIDDVAPQFNLECQFEDAMILTSQGYDCPADAMISLNVGDEIDVNTGWNVAGVDIPPLSGCVGDNCAADEELIIRVTDKTASDDVCDNRLTITFVAEDNCGNISEPFMCSYIVKDDTAPTFTAPEDAMVYSDNKCEYDVSVQFTGDVTDEADNCNNQLEATYSDSEPVPGQCEGEVIITRTWSLADACGNEAEDQVQIITVKDNIAPTFKKPDDITIYTDEECQYNDSPDVTGFPTEIDDNCTTELEPGYTDEVEAGECPGEYTITRTWTLADDCGNEAIPQVQIITVEDNIAPELMIPADETVQCDDIPAAGVATATDNCDPNVTVELISENEVDNDGDDCVATYKIFRIWLATDCAGNTTQKTQEITVIDSTKPMLQLPPDITVECDNVPVLDEGAAMATDNCDPNPVVEFIDEKIEQGDDNCPAAYILFRSWRATDCSGNTVTGTQTIIVEDTTAPVLTIPADVTVECDMVPEVPQVSAQDNCDPEVSISEVNEVRTDGDCPYNYILTRSWTATDDCGNSVTETQTITVQDTTAPTFKKPGDIEVFTDEECEYNASPEVTGFPTEIADNCSSAIVPTYEDNILPGECTGSYIIERTWSLVDECNNAAEPQVQIITVSDNIAPEFNLQCQFDDVEAYTSQGADCPADAMISLNVGDEIDINTGWTVAGLNVPAFGSFCVGDNCTPAEELIIRVTDKTSSDDVCENRLTITFVAEDDCGNISDPFTCSYIIIDDTAPTFTAPEDTVIYSDNKCEYDAGVEFTGDVIDEADNCNNQLEATYLDAIDEGQCEGEVIITRTWSLMDSCGNKAEDQVQIITVKDNIAPTFKKPDDIEIFKDEQCYADETPANTGYPTEVDDNCSTELEPMYTDEITPICEGSYLITRTWTLADDCENEAIPQVQKITVTDNMPPSYTPARDQIVECGPGNTGMCTYYVQLFDSFNDGWQGDTIDVVVNGEVVLDDLALADLFGGEDPVEGENDPIPFEVTTGDTIMTIYVQGTFAGEASWEVSDANQQVVAVGDGDTPVDIIADCGEIVPSSDEQFEAWLADNGGATAFDNCSDVTWTNNSQGLSDLCGATGSETVTFTATDDCGNSISTTATFTIQDTTPPSIDEEAMDMTVECDGNGNVDALNTWLDSYGGAMASDVCGSISWSHDFEGLSDDCGATGSATVTFTVMDECENVSTTTATFTIEDTTAPEFTFVPADRLDLECGVDEVPTDEALAGDDCGMVEVTSEDYYTNTPWRTITNGGDGTVDYSALPGGFTIVGSDTGSSENFFTVSSTMVKNVVLTFDWDYTTEEFSSYWDRFSYFVNGVETEIESQFGNSEASGSLSIPLSAGDTFALGTINRAGDIDGTATIEISNINFEIDNECPVVECFIREFTAEDECGNKSYAQQIIVFNDTTDPELEVPADLTVECDAVPPVCPDANGGGGQVEPAAWINEFHYDNAGSDQGEFVEVAANFDASGYKVVLYNGNGGSVYETLVLASPTMVGGVYYFVVSDSVQNGSPDGIALADASDNLIQFLSYEGAFMGSGGPADGVMSTDIGISEASNTPVGESLQLVGTGSAYADFAWSGPMAETPGAANTGQTIEVGGGHVGGDDPNISCITYSDLCDEAPKATYDGEERVDGDCPNNYTLIRTWTVTDNCGNSTTKSQTITVQDTTAPTFTAPADTEIFTDFECKYNASPDVTGDVEDEMDNCSEDLNATYEDVITDGPCEGSKVITRTWSLVDECNNAADDQVQIITVTDNTPPTFTAPENTVIECTESTDPSNPNVGDVTDEADNCTTSLDATYSDVITEGNCAGNYIITRTWSLQDDCGNKAEDQIQVITVEDKEAPELKPDAVIPMGESNINACLADAPFGPTLEEIADLFVDNCSEVVVTRAEKILGDDCYWSIMYSYFIADDCGNEVEAPIKVFYNGGDKNAPTIIEGSDLSFLDDVSGLQCLDDAPDAPKVADIEAIFEDDCGDEIIVEELDAIILGDDCGWSVTYSWDVSDDCGNYAETVSVTYSGADTMAPELTGTPPDSYQNGLVGCIDDSPVITDDMIRPLYTDNCAANEDLVIEIIRKEAGTNCNWIVTYDVFVSDACGNDAAMMKFNYQGSDTVKPQFFDECQFEDLMIRTSDGYDCPADATISLNVGDVIDNSTGWYVAGRYIPSFGSCVYDNCTAKDDLIIRVVDKTNEGGDCENRLTITFELEDECGNVSDTFMCSYVVKDDTAPELTPVADQDFGVVPEGELNQGLPAGLVDKTGYTDNCQDPGMTTTFNDHLSDDGGVFTPNPGGDSSNGITYTCGGFDYNFVYWYTDNSGRPVYYADNVSFNFYLYFYGSGWTTQFYSGGNYHYPWYTTNDHSTLPSCDVYDYVDNTSCGLSAADCGGGQGGILKTTYTLVRTFSADDGCGNIGYTQVTYTWMVETVVDDNVINSQAQGSQLDEFPCDLTDDTIDHGDVPADPSTQARVTEEPIKIDFQAYPVPFDKEVTISYEFEFETEVTIEFFDTKGLLIAKRFNKNYVAGTKDQTYVDLSRYPNQMYYVKLTTNRGSVTKKIISSGK